MLANILSRTKAAPLSLQSSSRGFKSLNGMSKTEWIHCSEEYEAGVMAANKMSDRMIALIESQRGADKMYGFKVDLFDHQLQSASRAYADGEEEEIIVAALFHDAAEYLSPHNHGPAIGEMLYPFLSPKAFWILSHHDLFQTYYYLHHSGRDPDELRAQFKDHPFYDDTAFFCENYDENCFDAEFKSKELDFFRPIVHRFFGQQPFWWNDGVNPKSG